LIVGDFLMPEGQRLLVSARCRSTPLLRRMVIAAPLLALAAGSAYVGVPLPAGPVPMTMQSPAVLPVGIGDGARTGASVYDYIISGVMSFPDGVSVPGLTFLAMPTGGFLLAIPGASFLAGQIAGSATDRWLCSGTANVAAMPRKKRTA
jgi:biotin transporter BioY